MEKAIEIDPKNQSLVADLTRVSYKIDEINNSYVSNQNNYFYKEERKPKEAPEPEPERRIFGGNIGTIEKIQKRTPCVYRKRYNEKLRKKMINVTLPDWQCKKF